MEKDLISGVSAKELFNGKESYSYDDFILLDTIYSDIESERINLNVNLKNIHLRIPILSSPMDTVSESEMAISLNRAGGISVIHNNSSPDFQADEIKKVHEKGLEVLFACGTLNSEHERIEKCFNAGACGVVVDTSQGNTKYSTNMLKYIKEKYPTKILIGGNVSTIEGCKTLIDSGVDAIRVGQSPGSICVTSRVLGIGRPQATAVYECAKYSKSRGILVIADGGIKDSGDIFKALALGADLVMLGKLFAGCTESPSKLVEKEGKKFKEYRGMGSREVLIGKINARDYAIEAQGVSSYVPYSGDLSNLISEKIDSLKKSMHVINCTTLSQLHNKTFSGELRLEKLSDNSTRELKSHSVILKD